MGIVIGFLPIVLWLVAVIMAVAIITFTIGQGHIFTPRAKRPVTEPVDWSMVKMHFLSFVMALIPFPVFVFLADSMDARLRDFCDAAQLPAAVIVFVLVLLENVAMYFQARNASETAMDRRIGASVRKNDDDIGIR